MGRPAAAPEISELVLEGTPAAMGRAHGEHWRECIREVCSLRLAATIRWGGGEAGRWTPESLLAAMPPFVEAQATWAPAVHAEFLGIAEGAGVSPSELMIGNGYTDLRDYAALQAPDAGGCTTFSVLPGERAGQVVVGQTWDMDQAVLPYVFVCRRRPLDGPETLGVTLCGCLSLIGLNEAGLAIGNSNLRPTDARVGVQYLAIIHEALSRRALDEAVEVTSGAPRASGHHYYLADAARVVHLEATATRCLEYPRDGLCHVHSNDYRDPVNALAAMPLDPLGRSVDRRCALADRLAGGEHTIESLQRALEDQRVAVREPVLSSISCAAVLLRPGTRELWATHGPPEPGAWRRYRL